LNSRAAQREAIQTIDEKLSGVGKLDLIRGQPVYLADKSNKRKKLHEPDQAENAPGHLEKVKKPRKPKMNPEIGMEQNNQPQRWVAHNYQSLANPSTSTIPLAPAPTPAVDNVAVASSSNGNVTMLSRDPPRPAKKAKKAKVFTSYTYFPPGDSACPLCGGPKHQLRDCLVPKGGIEK
jgi:hypothetical protein